MKYNDLQALPLVVLAFYTGILLNAIDMTKGSPRDVASISVVMHKWIRVEAFLYVSNVVGIAVFLFIRSMMSRFHMKVVVWMQDYKCERLTDALSKHFWNSFVMQWAVNNFLVSLFVYYLKDYNHQPKDSR